MDNRNGMASEKPPPWPAGIRMVKWMGSLSAAQHQRGRPVAETGVDLYQYVTPARITFDRLLRADPRRLFGELQHVLLSKPPLPPARIELVRRGYTMSKTFLHDLVAAFQYGAERKGDRPEDRVVAQANRVDLWPLFTKLGWLEQQLALWDRLFEWTTKFMALPFPARLGFVELGVVDSLRIASGDDVVLDEYAREAVRRAAKALRYAVPLESHRDAIRDVSEALVIPTLQRLVAELFWYGKEVLQGDDDFYREGEFHSRIGLCKHCGRPFVRMRWDHRYCDRACLKAEERTHYTRGEPRRLKPRPYDSAEELPMMFNPDDAAASVPAVLAALIMVHCLALT